MCVNVLIYRCAQGGIPVLLYRPFDFCAYSDHGEGSMGWL